VQETKVEESIWGT